MFYSEKDDREKRLRFSIRKVSFGAASVAVAALYLFMGSGAVSAAEAQAVQSNEEVAADKDSETEEQQPTYAAPAAKEQGSATNTEAGDEGKQESHPGAKEEEVNSSERSETTTKIQSDEDSVSGDSSSPKSTEDSEGTRSEEASNKPKVRKRRDAPAPTATPTDDDTDANQVFEAPNENENVDGLRAKLVNLSDTINNETKLANIDQVAAAKSIDSGTVKELDEFGGWKAVRNSAGNGKFAVARKTADGVFPIETVNTVKLNTNTNRTWTSESVVDLGNNHVLLLSEVRTEKTKDQEVFDNSKYQANNEGPKIARGLKGYNGIEKTFKAFSPTTGSTTKVSFKTGYTGDIDGSKAKYKVEVLGRTTENSNFTSLYSVTFDPSRSTTDANMRVTAAQDGRSSRFETPRGSTTTETLNKKLAESSYRPNGRTGTFTSKDIEIPVGYTEYTVRISSADNTRLGMGYQVPWKHYALPVVGTGFSVTQDTRKVAKDLAKKVYDKLTEQRDEDTKWSTPETKTAYEAKLQEIKDKLASEDSTTSNYKDVVRDALEKRKTLNEELKIKHKAADEIAEKAAEKLVMIDDDDTLSENEKDAAKEEVIENAKKAANNVKVATDQASVEKAKMEGIDAITKVTPVGRDNAKAEVA
ncbi:YSIRK-type signal peptide-containing protein, partial [Streptococcus pseudopneumoniae]|uniref:YSIRK-type signal peptide-containing protein n=1 Tax=Streptococcus pseudopneumoniae TaxID=257758 RepID=UPI000B2509A5